MVFRSTFADVQPPEEVGGSLSVFYWKQLDKFAANTLLVDDASGRTWTGAQIKAASARIAGYLVEKLQVRPADSCVFFTSNSDYAHVAALGVILAGASVCAGSHLDPTHESRYMVEMMRPALIFADNSILDRLIIMQDEFNFKICLMDDEQRENYGDKKVLSFHTHLLSTKTTPISAPIQVQPHSAAYVLFTSGSTGQPKAVARTHLNSLYVCHSLNMQPPLWDLTERSVLSNHVPLDHGTGTFCIKMMLAKGLKLVVMDGYELNRWLNAVEKHQITDVMLGSAHLHNMMSSAETAGRQLSSLRNLMAVGSRLVSHQLACSFMDRWPEARVRQTLGMTEVGFISMVSRESARTDDTSVGLLLPNLRIKLLDVESDEPVEITEYDREGEMLVAGPTVSPGYLGTRFEEQSRAAFQIEGDFYRSHDLGRLSGDHRLFISGRRCDVLCLDDGWKVLPQEIELILLQHPGISEVAVVGMPHPELPGCHAPRAYVVPEEAWRDRLEEQEVARYAAQQVSEHKRLLGGVRILTELPRVSGSGLAKVDKRALLKLA